MTITTTYRTVPVESVSSMKLTLRQSEIDTILSALGMAINTDYPNNDRLNAAYIRLIKKLRGTI